MDPNANLREQERILIEMDEARRTQDSGELPYQHTRRARLWELRYALRGWLNFGGFAPRWSESPRAARYFNVS